MNKIVYTVLACIGAATLVVFVGTTYFLVSVAIDFILYGNDLNAFTQ